MRDNAVGASPIRSAELPARPASQPPTCEQAPLEPNGEVRDAVEETEVGGLNSVVSLESAGRRR